MECSTASAFVFDTLRARRVDPLHPDEGVIVAGATITKGRYLHAASHERGGYDALALESLSSGLAKAGTVLQADGSGGAAFVEVPVAPGEGGVTTLVSMTFRNVRIKYTTPTRIALFDVPKLESHYKLKARVMGHGSAFRWRLFHPRTLMTLATGESNADVDIADLPPQDQIELHAWLDASDPRTSHRSIVEWFGIHTTSTTTS